jgi:hypothetical protein
MNKLKARVFLVFLLTFSLTLTRSLAVLAAGDEGTYKVDISVQTQKWAYPNEEITVQGVTVLEKSEAPPSHNWTYVSGAYVTFEVQDSNGNVIDVGLPQGLSSDGNGRFQFTFHAPVKEGNYTMIAHAVINGNTTQTSQIFAVSPEQRPTQDPPIHTTTSSSDVDVRIFIVASVIIAILAILIAWRSTRN